MSLDPDTQELYFYKYLIHQRIAFKLFCLQLTAQNMLAHTSTCTVHIRLNQFHKAILLFTTYNVLCYFSILFSPPHPTSPFKTCWLKSTNLISNPLMVRVSSLEMLSGALMKVQKGTLQLSSHRALPFPLPHGRSPPATLIK